MLLKKIDLVLQAIAYGFLIAFLIAGHQINFTDLLIIYVWWQFASAALNTWSFLKSPYSKKIKIYWILTASDLFILFGIINTEILNYSYAGEIISFTPLYGTLGIAAWYWYSYLKLLRYTDYKNEITGIIKS